MPGWRGSHSLELLNVQAAQGGARLYHCPARNASMHTRSISLLRAAFGLVSKRLRRICPFIGHSPLAKFTKKCRKG